MKETFVMTVAAATGREVISMLDMMMEPERTECCSFWIIDGDEGEKIIIYGALLSNRNN